jgi:hypothetical protein
LQGPAGCFCWWCGIRAVALALLVLYVAAASTAEPRGRRGPGMVVDANEELSKRRRIIATGISSTITDARKAVVVATTTEGNAHRARRGDEDFSDEPFGDDLNDEPNDEFGGGLGEDFDGSEGEGGGVRDGDAIDSAGEDGDGEDGDGDGEDGDGEGGDGDGEGGGGGQEDVGDEDTGGEDAGGEDAGGEGDGDAGGEGDGAAIGGVDSDGEDPDSNGDSSSGTEDGAEQGGDSSPAGEQGTDGEGENGTDEEDTGDSSGGEESDPSASPAAQPTTGESDGDGSGASAPGFEEPSPASAPSSESPAPTRRPSHAAGRSESPVSSYTDSPQDGAPSSENQSYADMAKAEYDSMVHDRNVLIVATVFGALGFVLLLVTAQQMIENPDGCCARMCRCSIAFWRVVCWPCRKVCGCAKPKRRGHAVVAGGDNDYGGYSHDLELT